MTQVEHICINNRALRLPNPRLNNNNQPGGESLGQLEKEHRGVHIKVRPTIGLI